MGRYILKRLLMMIPIILAASILIFTLMSLAPGEPEELILGADATEEAYAAKRAELGLDDSYPVRLGRFLKQTYIDFDLGTSWFYGVPVKDAIAERFPRTLMLSFIAIILAVAIGVPLGIVAAINQNRWPDSLSMVIALVGVSMPLFWLALELVLIFAVQLGWLPPMGIGGLQYYILPAIAVGFNSMASFARQTRSSMLNVIRSDYIVMARAKGVKESSVIIGHALKNALIPIITSVGSGFGYMLGGMMIVETIFSIPGMGEYMITAVNNRDYPVVQGGTMFIAVVFSLCMLLVDILYALADPRIKAQYASPQKAKRRAENG